MIVLDCAIKWAELAYYLFFIVLTILIVYYARKTFQFESKSDYDLLCGIVFQEGHNDEVCFEYSLEIYNAGNKVAKKVEIKVEGKHITSIDFVKPRSSSIYPIGTLTKFGKDIIAGPSIEKGTPLQVSLLVDGKEKDYDVCTDSIFVDMMFEAGSLERTNYYLEKISGELNEIAKKR